jgi:iron complex outermembrane receptor protein
MTSIEPHKAARAETISIFSVLILFTLSGTHSRAQDLSLDEQEDVVEEIVVTGSRIKRRDFHSASPIATIDKDDIDFSGQATLEETLNQMPQIMPDLGRTSNNPGNGTATLNLRGLGAGRTLVLLNGRRLAPSGVGSAVDVNNLPQSLIDRVELITGGASTVYGSDAIAGVVNFITRTDFDGFSLDAGVYMAEQGDAEVYDLNVAYGHNLANGRGNITAFAGVYERKESFAADREITATTIYDDWEGSLMVGGSSRTPATRILFPAADLGNGPVSVTFNPDGTPREFLFPEDLFEFQDWTYLQTPLSRYSLGVMANYEFTDRLEGYVEAAFTHNEATLNLAPVPAVTFALVNTDNPVLAQETQQLFNDSFLISPGLAGMVIGRRLIELDARREQHDRDYARIVAGLRGPVFGEWDMDVWVTYTKASEDAQSFNAASESRLLQGLLVDPLTNQCVDPSGGCVPLNIFGEGNLSAAGADFIRINDINNKSERTQKLASLVLTGPLFATWAGQIDVATGLEWRSDSGRFKADDKLFTGDALGFGGAASVDGIEEVFEIYAEAIIPLAQDLAWADYLALEVGGRLSEYKNAGSAETYKIGLEWQPFSALRLRSMSQRSVRAPNNVELFEAQQTVSSFFVGNNASDDPCSASNDPIGNGNREKCVSQGLVPDQVGIFEATPFYPTDFTSGGNPDLKPEVAETWTVGLILTPETFSNWSISVDYFELSVEGTIGDIFASLACFDQENTVGIFCDNIVRDNTGNVSAVAELTSNRGKLETNGVDTQLQYVGDLPSAMAVSDGYAQLSVTSVWTHTNSIASQQSVASELVDCAGLYGWPCDAFFSGTSATWSKNRVTTNANYLSGPWNLHLTWRWIEGTVNAAPIGADIFGYPPPDLAIAEIDDEHYFDLGFAYAFREHITLRFGVSNLFDNDPPMMADAVFVNNTDTMMFDTFGRSYYLSLSANY